jgi:ubiquinone/menaquinone biosynthesis C-methylase UbiE
MSEPVELMRASYDRIATDYDALWSVHVRAPQERLTRELELSRGLHCADLGCGTGLDTLDMLMRVAPGEVLGVDLSDGMLEAARQRAHAAGYALGTSCQAVDEFLRTAESGSFDVITMRFCLGYLDWREALLRLPRLLRPGGRLGILTILANSAPQAYATYRGMVSELGLPAVAVPTPTADEISAQLRIGGAAIRAAWTHSFRLWFESGTRMASWLQQSGVATHPALSALPVQVAASLWAYFAERVEAYREADGVPLDFELVGLVASV